MGDGRLESERRKSAEDREHCSTAGRAIYFVDIQRCVANERTPSRGKSIDPAVARQPPAVPGKKTVELLGSIAANGCHFIPGAAERARQLSVVVRGKRVDRFLEMLCGTASEQSGDDFCDRRHGPSYKL